MLTQKTLTQEHKMRLRWLVVLSSLPLLSVVTAFGIVPAPEIQPNNLKTVVEEITLPKPALIDSTAATFWRNERVQRGDTVDELLRRMNVEDGPVFTPDLVGTERLIVRNPPWGFSELLVGHPAQGYKNPVATRWADPETIVSERPTDLAMGQLRVGFPLVDDRLLFENGKRQG